MFEMTPHFQKLKKHPLYLQLYEFIKQEIQEGRIQAGRKLPSKRKLAVHLNLGLNTVDAAYQQLIAEGYVESVLRKGYFVVELEGNIIKKKDQKPPQQPNFPEIKSEYKIDFNHGEVDLKQFPFSIWRKLLLNTSCQHELFMNGNPQGERNLRVAIADSIFQSRGVRCSPDQIIIGAGTQYLMQLLCLLLGKNRTFAMEDPGFHRIRHVFQDFERKIEGIPLDEDGLTVEHLRRIRADIVYVTPSHQFPTGTIMPISRRMELLKWAREKQAYIIEDDYDGEFRYVGKPIPSLQGLDTNSRVIYLGTFSKAFIPSIRVSYLILPPDLLKVYHQNFSGYKHTVPRIIQEALYQFIDNGHWERHINKMRTIYRKKNHILTEVIQQHFDNRVTVIGEKSGLHILLQINNGLSETELVERATQVGVNIYPTSLYYEKGKYSHEPTILLGYGGLSHEELQEGILLLKKAWF
ncbi:PLP-dependent aminotransferase family protein [Peribacillus loiseleuriae]|uniref:GntR family transcriptional regulator n=1 Tax=Peribacillus loiseleuriae TaxID=1679170 RepID=A0A0K9GYH1_9BACI|nr:PLP-dependent aminotransferase family protein [Peribacillus loiseleuriae]KMY51646.1 GntR family transcriptional regulator [Peribacillus loiseleuriae]